MRVWLDRVCLLALSLILCENLARAQAEPLAPNAAAVELGYAGLQLFEAQRYEQALERFNAAEALAHSPVFVLRMAQCEEKLGRLLAAKARLEAMQAPLGANAPQAWQTAQRDAAAELRSIAEELPRVRVTLKGAIFPVNLRDGGRSLSLARADSVIELDPGEHSLTVTDAHARAVTRTVQAASGVAPAPLVFQLEALVAAPRAAHPNRPEPLSARKWGEWTAVGVGSASLVLGGVAGVIALSKAHGVKADCVGNQCLARDQSKADSAAYYADLSTVAVAVGVASLAVGITLIATESKPAQPHLRATVSSSGVALEGAF